MKTSVIRRILVIAGVVLLAACGCSVTSPARQFTHIKHTSQSTSTIRILTLGDSITANCGAQPPGGYCAPLGQLLASAGITATFINEAVGGTDCGFTANNIHLFLTRDLPNPQSNDLVLLNCGTNNVPTTPPATTAMGTQWRTIVEAIHVYGVHLCISFIGYSNPVNNSVFHANLPVAEAAANDTIYRNMGLYPWSWWAGLADFQAMPGDRDYLDEGGLHPTPLGYERMADTWYRAVEGTMGWPDTVPWPCGMWGYRPGGTPGSFINCVHTS